MRKKYIKIIKIICLVQCCGSGSAGISIGLAAPSPYWECESRSLEIDKKKFKSGFVPFKRLLYLFGMSFELLSGTLKVL
jgi:hypothetical protein